MANLTDACNRRGTVDNTKYLPSEIRIGAQLYKVIGRDNEWHEDTGDYGKVDFSTHEVSVATEGRTLGEILDTLLHETLHIIWFEWNLPTRPKEERAVRGLGTGMAAVYAQNPEYVEAIARIVEEINDV
jgi:hypothetical protein